MGLQSDSCISVKHLSSTGSVINILRLATATWAMRGYEQPLSHAKGSCGTYAFFGLYSSMGTLLVQEHMETAVNMVAKWATEHTGSIHERSQAMTK